MPIAPTGVCLLSVLSLCVIAVLAVLPCDQKIIDGFKNTRNCYFGGEPPKQEAPFEQGTHVLVSKGELPENTKCATTSQKGTDGYMKVFLKNNTVISGKYTLEYKKDHIIEAYPTGTKFRLYVIHNKSNVYSYYRCIDTAGVAGADPSPGRGPMVDIAVGCKFVRDPQAKSLVAKSKACFNRLNIRDTIDLTPCIC